LRFRHGFKAEANRISVRVRLKMGLLPVEPIDPALVCEHFDVVLLKLSELDCDVTRFLGADHSAFSAVTVPCGPRTAIVHNDSHHEHRQRSNICHELAHCFLGHQCTPPLTEDGDRARDGSVEAEANFLAGALLIPNEAAIHIVRNGLVATAQKSYGVSQQMLEYRLRVSGARTIHSRYMRAIGKSPPRGAGRQSEP
jgi:hypothetical protein